MDQKPETAPEPEPEPFGLGPEWAWGTTCCGKPMGCTNMSNQCWMLNHPWKKKHREEFGADIPESTDVP